MKIRVNFLNGNAWWRAYVLDNSAKAASILSDPSMLGWVAAHEPFDFTSVQPSAVALQLENIGEVTIDVGFYWNPFGLAIAKESDGAVYFNTAKLKKGAGSPGNCAHETMHALDYEHDGNGPEGNQNTVPWAIGNEVDRRAIAFETAFAGWTVV